MELHRPPPSEKIVAVIFVGVLIPDPAATAATSNPETGDPGVSPNSRRNCRLRNHKACRVPPPLTRYRNAARLTTRLQFCKRLFSREFFEKRPLEAILASKT